MGFSGVAAGLKLQAATPMAGFALQNGTPTILSWTTPNDGQQHRVIVYGEIHVSNAETGGQVNSAGMTPDGTSFTVLTFGGGQGVGVVRKNLDTWIIAPNTTFSLVQNTALTAGTAILWAEIWGL